MVVLSLTKDQRKAVEQFGTPLAFVDDVTHARFVLLAVDVKHAPPDGFVAHVQGIPAYAEGETEDEATIALLEAIRVSLKAFGEE